MNMVLWILQCLLAAFAIMGGSWKAMSYDPAAAPVAMRALPPMAWRALGGLEVLCGLGLVLPAAFKKRPGLTPVAAALLTVDGLLTAWVSVHYSPNGAVIAATDPLVYTLAMAFVAAFVAYGRLVLKPLR